MASIPPATPFESAMYVGISLQNILYGVELVLYLKTMRVFLGRSRERHESDVFFAAFSTVMLLLVTCWVVSDAMIGEDIWLLDRDYPGGPLAYLTGPPSDWYNRFRTVVTIIMQQMADGLMVHRSRIVWDSRRVIIIPCILWLVNLVLGILGMATQRTDPYTGIFILFAFTYYVLAVLLTTTLTCMICYRLLRHAREVKELLGEEFASPYFTIAMLLVESVLPYTLCGLVFLATFGAGSWAGMATARAYTLMMCVSPQMLILRVAEGNAWEKDTIRGPTSVMKFSPSHGDTSGSSSSRFDDRGAAVKHPETLPSVYHPESEKHSDKV
ncbi:hypothetical protein HD554DRAFT_2174751 [Boletus coccyginus]|nr:hypothetical protein HD554DRAFT_2174751 [Boletus coccyginus]